MTIPVIMTKSGRQNQTPTELFAQLTALVAATNPGYTNNLPGSLIADIAGTDVAAVTLMDQAVTELINSVTPYGANEFLLAQIGNIYGVARGATTNTSVNVTFTGDIGYIIPIGFTVSDGNHQYTVTDGGVIGSSGSSLPLYCVATQEGSWAVPAGSVTSLSTSVPAPYTVTCTNVLAGTPSGGGQSNDDYRAQVLNSGLIMSTGMANMLTAALMNIPGVQQRLIAIQQQAGGNWKILVGGGDPYQIAYQIYVAMGFNIGLLAPSQINALSITKANPGVVTTDLNHGLESLPTGGTAQINGALGMTAINGVPLSITVINEKSFSVGVNTTAYGTYTGGGVVAPNNRNQAKTIIDGTNTYSITYIAPPQQTVVISLIWNAYNVSSIVSSSSVKQLSAPAIAAYVNAIPLGQPINVFSLDDAFRQSVASLIPANLIDRLVFSVYINGVLTAPSAGTGAIAGDIESYFYTTENQITITQG